MTITESMTCPGCGKWVYGGLVHTTSDGHTWHQECKDKNEKSK